ncbi:MAG: tetratricopeptide repeat protein [Bacteroidales bacterium]|nr:tetratricopeptide repeat protein [Bacteroidales bacterium]
MLRIVGFMLFLVLILASCQPANQDNTNISNYKTYAPNSNDSLNPNFHQTFNLLHEGLAELNQKHYRSAIHAFDSAIALCPTYSITWANRGSAYFQAAKYDATLYYYALDDIKKAISLKQDHKYFYNLGLIYKHIGNYQKAIQCFVYFICTEKSIPSAYYHLGICYKELKEYDKAEYSFSKAIHLASNVAEFYFDRALLYAELQLKDLKLKDLKSTIKQNPEHSLALHEIGMHYKDAKKYYRAIYYFNKAIAVNPLLNNTRYERVKCYQKLNKNSKALEDISILIKVSPDDTLFYKERIEIYKSMDYMLEARKDENTIQELRKI